MSSHRRAAGWVLKQSAIALVAYIVVIGLLFNKPVSPFGFLFFWGGWMTSSFMFDTLAGKFRSSTDDDSANP